MPLYRSHFATEPHEPFPPLDSLPSVECDDPLEAVHLLVDAGRYAQNPVPQWARVVLNAHDNGVPRQVLRVPLSVAADVPASSMRRDDGPSV